MQKNNPEGSLILKALLEYSEETKLLEEYEDILYGKDKNLAKVKAIVAQIYIQLEELLNAVITVIFLGSSPKKTILELFNKEILDKVNISRKISIITKSNKFDNKILSVARKINDLRNDLLHFKVTQPMYGKRSIKKDKKIIKDVISDFLKVNDHLIYYCLQFYKNL